MLRWWLCLAVAMLASVTFAEPVTITGVVLDPDGKPVEGARVTTLHPPAQGLTWLAADTATGPDGAFSLEFNCERPPEQLTVTAMADGYAFAWERVEVGNDAPVRLTLGGDPGVVRGNVLDAAGAPAAGATIYRSNMPVPPFKGHEYPSSVTADAQGRFAMPGLPGPMGVTLVAISAGGGAAVGLRCVPREQPEVELRLAPPGSVTGVVYGRDGGPVANLKVYLSGYGSISLPPGGAFRTSGSTKTDQHGRYRFDGLVAGLEYTIGYMAPGSDLHCSTDPFTAEGGAAPTVCDIHLGE